MAQPVAGVSVSLSIPSVIALIAALAGAPDAPAAGGAPVALPTALPASQVPATDTDDDDEDAAPPTPSAPVPYQVPGVRPYEPPASMPASPQPYSPSANDRIPSAPVTVEAYQRSYETPPDATERNYQAGIQRNFDAQQVRMGPLDGGWTVRTESGAGFMALMLSDSGRADQEVEGAWRTLGARAGQKPSGFLLSVARVGRALVVRWYPSDETGNINIMRLNPTADGKWTGVVRAGDVEFPVVMSRGP
jgi:hypothetical protein